MLGDSPAFAVPAYALKSPWELPLYLGLGVFSGLGALAFVKTLYFMEDLFEGWKFPPYLKPAVGGLGLGVLGYFLPQVFGTGFDTIEQTLNGNLGLALLVILITFIVDASITAGYVTLALTQASCRRIDRGADGFAGHEKFHSPVLLASGRVIV